MNKLVGVEFAQKWFSVKEKLPDRQGGCSEDVLTRNNNGWWMVCWYSFEDECWYSAETSKEASGVIEWKLIELK